MLESFMLEADTHGYDITFINRNLGGKRKSYLHHCRYRGVDGVIIACVDFDDPEVQELVNSNIPLVTVDRIFDNRLAILSDNANGVSTLVRYVYSKGHRKIAFIHGEQIAVTSNRLLGFHQTCQELGLEIPEEYIINCVYQDPRRCAEATRQLLALPDRPTCILFPDDYSLIGGSNVLREAGLRIPEDISVVGYNGIYLAEVLRLTTYRQNAVELGKIAAERLISLIEQPQSTSLGQIMVKGHLMEGYSVKEI